MAFPVTLYAFSKEVNSTARPSGTGVTYQCVTNTDFDVLNPAIPLNIGTDANPTQYNYCYIPAFRRYYWISSWSMERSLWVAHCNVDALASWKTQIGATSAYVLRAAAEHDGNITDMLYPATVPTVTDTIITKWWEDDELDYDDGHFVIGTIGANGATAYTGLYPQEFQAFCTEMFSDAFFNGVKGTSDLLKAQFNPMQYLASATWFPGRLGGGRTRAIPMGYWTSSVSGFPLAHVESLGVTTITLPKHPQADTRGEYLNAPPYTHYLLDIPPFGRIVLDPAMLHGVPNITLIGYADPISGMGQLRVTTRDSQPGSTAPRILLATVYAQVGVTVQISQVLRDYLGTTTSVIGSVAGAVASAATGNVAGAITGGLSAISSAITGAFPDVSTSGVDGGFMGLFGDWKLISTFYPVVDEDNAHRGRPLCQVRRLDTLPGYQLCTDTDVSIPATREEIDTIRGYLEGGYYYE